MPVQSVPLLMPQLSVQDLAARRRTGATAVASGALLVLAALFAAPPTASVAAELPSEALQAIVDEAVQSGLPGAVVRVEAADGEVWTGAAGTATIGGARMTTDSLFRLFSITKTITAATAFTLIDEGRLGLDDPIGRWLDPALIADLPHGSAVTVRHLIAQTSGIRDYYDPQLVDAIRANFGRVWTPAELVLHAASGDPQSPPGDAASHYANTNYALLGLIIEKVTGMTLADAIRDRVLDPLGASETYSGSAPGHPAPVAGYYSEDGELLDVSAIDQSVMWASGDMLSTAADTAKLLRGILAGELLSVESRALMTGDFRPLAGRGVDYGYGTFRVPVLDPAPVGHSGEGPGGASLALRWPDDGTILVILTNLDNGAHMDMLFKVAAALGKSASPDIPLASN